MSISCYVLHEAKDGKDISAVLYFYTFFLKSTSPTEQSSVTNGEVFIGSEVTFIITCEFSQ